MARNLKFFFDSHGIPRARGPHSERVLMSFLESDVQGSDQTCRNLMDDIIAIEEDESETREFVGNAHSVVISAEGVLIEPLFERDEDHSESGRSASDATEQNDDGRYRTGLKHFREILEDWESFILDDQLDEDELT